MNFKNKNNFGFDHYHLFFSPEKFAGVSDRFTEYITNANTCLDKSHLQHSEYKNVNIMDVTCVFILLKSMK